MTQFVLDLGGRRDRLRDLVAHDVAGTTPFTAESPVAVLLQHLHEPLPAPADRSSASRWMDAIGKATAKDPADRWASAGAFVDALESSIGGAPPRGGRTTRQPELFGSWRRMAVAGGVVVAVAGAVWMTGQQRLSPEAPSSASGRRWWQVRP